MLHVFSHLVLGVFALFFLYTGIMSLWRPEQFARALSLQPADRSGIVEIRAQYGGFFYVAAMTQFAPFFGIMTIQSALMISVVIFGGLFLGRICAIFLDGDGQPLTPMIRSLFAVDGIGFAAALSAMCL